MSVCTFLGHRTVPDEVGAVLRPTLIDLIEKHGVTLFYIGNHGEFDAKALREVKELSTQYHITYFTVLAYIPERKIGVYDADYSNTILPDGIETVPKRFAIEYRNKWMIERADYVVTYVSRSAASGAAKFKKYAEKKKKAVIELSGAI